MSGISGKALQEQVEDLQRLCPMLLPSMAPKGFQDEDLMQLSMAEGLREQRQLDEVLSEAARSCQSCCMCAAAGTGVSASMPCQEDEACVLRFTTFSSINFAEKTINISKAGFACGQCRAVADTWRFLRFSAVKVGSSKPDRESLLRKLCLHFAAVNRAPDDLMASGDLVVAWVQEIFSRAYGLHVVANNISGWKVVVRGGQLQLGGAVKLAKLLLTSSEAKVPRKRKLQEQVEGGPAAGHQEKNKMGKKLKLQASKLSQKQQQQQPDETQEKPIRKTKLQASKLSQKQPEKQTKKTKQALRQRL